MRTPPCLKIRTTYSGLPAANAVPLGTEYVVTDIGFRDITVATDGSYWIPQGGPAEKAPLMMLIFSDFINQNQGFDLLVLNSGTSLCQLSSPVSSGVYGPGNWEGSTSTTVNGTGYFATGTGLQMQSLQYLKMSFGHVFFSAVPDATNDYKAYFGVYNSAATYMAAFTVDRASSANNAATNILCRCVVNGTITDVDSGIAIPVGYANGVMLDIHSTATQSKFYINKTLVATISANFGSSTPQLRIMGLISKVAGTSARQVGADFAYAEGLLISPRTLRLP